MNDPGVPNPVHDERWWWEHRLPGGRGFLLPGPEKWKQKILPTLERCSGCEVKGEHYHEAAPLEE